MNITDVRFNEIPIHIDPSLPDDKLIIVNRKTGDHQSVWLQGKEETPDEKTAREVADRLLGRTGGALTLDLLQRAVDVLAKDIDKRVTEHVLLASPEIRREYLKLCDADQRYDLTALQDDGTHRTTYLGIDRGTDASGT